MAYYEKKTWTMTQGPGETTWTPTDEPDLKYEKAEVTSVRDKTYQFYWENPANVAGAYNRILTEPGVNWQQYGIDPDFVTEAYTRLQNYNKSYTWWEWDSLPETDVFRGMMRGKQAPVADVQDIEVYQPDWMTPIDPTQNLPTGDALADPNIPDWQKAAAFMMSNGTLRGVSMAIPWMALAGGAALAAGGVIPAVVAAGSALIAGGLLGFASDEEHQVYARQQLLNKGWDPKIVNFLQDAFNKTFAGLNVAAEAVEKGLGTMSVLGQPLVGMLPYQLTGNEAFLDEYMKNQQEYKRLIEHLPEVWEAGRLTYEAVATTAAGRWPGNIPAGIQMLYDRDNPALRFAQPGQVWQLGNPNPITLDKTGLALLQAAANENIAGADPMKTWQKYMELTGFSGQMADLLFQTGADPLNIVPIIERKGVQLGAKLTGNAILEQAAKNAVNEGAIGTMRHYGVFLRRGIEVNGVKAPLPTEFTRFQRWIADTTPEGILKDYRVGAEGAPTRVKRGLLTFAENPFNPVAWWNTLKEMTPRSKLSGYSNMAQSNLGEIIDSYRDVDVMMDDLVKFSQLPPAEAVVLGRHFANAEMYTVGQGMKASVDMLREIQGVYHRAENSRAMLLSLSDATGEPYHQLLRRIREGGPRQANTIFNELVNRVRQVQSEDVTRMLPDEQANVHRMAATATALLEDPMFSPAMFKNTADQIKNAPWAFDPGYFKAHVYQELCSHLESWAIEAFHVKPESALVRAGQAMKAMQSIVLLDFSPAYMLTNSFGNISTRAAEGSFGFLGPARIQFYLDFIGHPESKVSAGVTLADIPYRPGEGRKFASYDDAWNAGGLRAAMEYTNEQTRNLGYEASRADDMVQRWNDKIKFVGPMRRLSSKAESADSIAIHYQWTMGTYGRLWNRGASIPKMPEGVRASLARIDPRLPNLIMSGIESSYSKTDISRILTRITETARKADPYIESVAKALGVDSPQMREMLAKTNILEMVDTRLADGADIVDVVNSIKKEWHAIDEMTLAERIRSRAAAGAANIRGEGFAAVASAYRDAAWHSDEFWVRHFAEWQRTWALVKDMPPGERGKLKRERMFIQNTEWNAKNAREEALQAGMLKDTGFTDSNGELCKDAQAFVGEIQKRNASWKDFYKKSQDRISKFFRDSDGADAATRDRMWMQCLDDNAELYLRSAQAELETVRRQGELYLRMFGEQFGADALPAAAYWWRGVYDTTVKRQALMTDMRDIARGFDPATPEMQEFMSRYGGLEKDALWTAFLERVYLPQIGQMTQAHLDGVNALSDALVGAPTRAEWAEAMEFFGRDPAQVDPVEEAMRDIENVAAAESVSPETIAATKAMAADADLQAAIKRALRGGFGLRDFKDPTQRRKALVDLFDVPERDADMVNEIMDYVARTWGERNNRSPDDYWSHMLGAQRSRRHRLDQLSQQLANTPISEIPIRRLTPDDPLFQELITSVEDYEVGFPGLEHWKAHDMANEEWSSVNNRLSKELAVTEVLFGYVEGTELPVKKSVVKGGKLIPAKTTKVPSAFDVGQAVYKAAKDGTVAHYLDESFTVDQIANERGFTDPRQRDLFITEVGRLRRGFTIIESARDGVWVGDKIILTDNGKAGASVDFFLGTCQFTTNCKECYAAGIVYPDVIRKSIRNSILVAYDPVGFGMQVAAEINKVDKRQLPFLRLLGSGDCTSPEQVTAFNTMAQNIDRPIHIFSRHHEMLGQIEGTRTAPFIKMGSIDPQLVKVYDNKYGQEFLDRNLRDRGINNAFLFNDIEELPMLMWLRDRGALGLVFPTSEALFKMLPDDLKLISCPCDAKERSFWQSCRECALSNYGCYRVYADLGLDPETGKLYKLFDPNATPEDLARDLVPMLSFMQNAGRWRAEDAGAWTNLTRGRKGTTGPTVKDLRRMGWRFSKGELLESVNKLREAKGLEPYARDTEVPWSDAFEVIRQLPPPRAQAWAKLAGDIVSYNLADLSDQLNNFNKGPGHPKYQNYITLKDIRYQDHTLMLIDRNQYIVDYNAKHPDKPITEAPANDANTMYMDAADIRATASNVDYNYRQILNSALKSGVWFLPGGEVQPPRGARAFKMLPPGEMPTLADELKPRYKEWIVEAGTGRVLAQDSEVSYPRTNTEGFKRWFEGTAIEMRNADGTPRVFYHGTLENFTEFKSNESWQPPGKHLAYDQALGPHFAADPGIASRFGMGLHKQVWPYRAYEMKPGGNVMPVYLNLKKPLVIDQPSWMGDSVAIARHVEDTVMPNHPEWFVEWYAHSQWDDVGVPLERRKAAGQETWERIMETMEEFGESAERFSDYMEGESADALRPLISKIAQEYKRMLVEQGYDGIIYQNTARDEVGAATFFSKNYVPEYGEKYSLPSPDADVTYLEMPSTSTTGCVIVFDNTQIKSIANPGEYRIGDPNILHQDARAQYVTVGTQRLLEVVKGAAPDSAFHELAHYHYEFGLGLRDREIVQQFALRSGYAERYLDTQVGKVIDGRTVTKADIAEAVFRQDGDLYYRAVQETFADGYVKWLATGTLPKYASPSLHGIFQKFREFMRWILREVLGPNRFPGDSRGGVKLDEQIVGVYRRTLMMDPWEAPYAPGADEATIAIHRASVEEALKHSLDVSREVLDQHPDLVEQANAEIATGEPVAAAYASIATEVRKPENLAQVYLPALKDIPGWTGGAEHLFRAVNMDRMLNAINEKRLAEGLALYTEDDWRADRIPPEVKAEFEHLKAGSHEEVRWDECEAALQKRGAILNQDEEVDYPSLWEYPEVQISVARSAKRLPTVYKTGHFEYGTRNADILGGRYDNATEHLDSMGVENLIYDPYNRTREFNQDVMWKIQDGQCDTATVSDVLNKIAEPEHRARVIAQAANALKKDGRAYFTVGNRKPMSFYDDVARWFNQVDIENGMLIGTDPVNIGSRQPILYQGETPSRVTYQQYLTGRTIAGVPIVGAVYVDGVFAAYVPYRHDANRVLEVAGRKVRALGIDPDGNWVYRYEDDGRLRVMRDGEETVPAAGPYVPGTMESAGAMPNDESMHWQEGMSHWIDPFLDELAKQMKTGMPMTGEEFKLGDLSASDQAQFRRWIEQCGGALSQAKMAAIRVGDLKRDDALLDYGKRYGFDNYAQLLMPYQFWYTRSMVNWAVRMLDRPAFLAFFARLANFMDSDLDEQFGSIPSRLGGKLRIPVPFLNAVAPWAGGNLYLDPWGKLFQFREFLRPWERYLYNSQRVQRVAEQYIRTWSESGEYTSEEASQAIKTHSGALWMRAYSEAQQTEGSDAVDYISMISSPNLALSLAVRGTDKTGPFPLSRFMQGMATVTGWEGLATLDPEAKLRKNAKLSEYGEWGPYYIDRMLVNLAADGVVSTRDAFIAMNEKTGPVYDMALERVRLEMAVREPTLLPFLAGREAFHGDANVLDVLGAALVGLLPGGLLPEGELRMRGLYDDYQAAWAAKRSGSNPEAVNNFFKMHPEYEARLALYDEPDERMQRFLVSEVWDRYTNLPELARRKAREELGKDFQVMFLNSETSDYDALSSETLADWAQRLGGYAPGVEAPNRTTPIQFENMDLLQEFDQAKVRLFPMIEQVLENYWPADAEGRAMLRTQYPIIDQYWNWRDIYISQHPQLIPYMAATDPELSEASPETAYQVYMFKAEKARIFPSNLKQILDGYWALPTDQRRAYSKANPEVGDYWDWEREYLKKFPEVVKYVKSDQSAFKTMYGKDYTEKYGTPTNISGWPVEAQTALLMYLAGASLKPGARDYLYYQWEKSGEPFGNFNEWLNSLGVYFGR